MSDISGDVLDHNTRATVTIKHADARRGTLTLDVAVSEVDDLIRKGQKVPTRGRRPAPRPASDDL